MSVSLDSTTRYIRQLPISRQMLIQTIEIVINTFPTSQFRNSNKSDHLILNPNESERGNNVQYAIVQGVKLKTTHVDTAFLQTFGNIDVINNMIYTIGKCLRGMGDLEPYNLHIGQSVPDFILNTQNAQLDKLCGEIKSTCGNVNDCIDYEQLDHHLDITEFVIYVIVGDPLTIRIYTKQ